MTTTLATIRPLLLSNLNLKTFTLPNIFQPLSPSSPTPPPTPIATTTFFPIVISDAMHPDKLLLQGHGVTSPRLCSNSSASSIESGGIDTTNTNSNNGDCISPVAKKSPPKEIHCCGTSQMDEHFELELQSRRQQLQQQKRSNKSSKDERRFKFTATSENGENIATTDDDDDCRSLCSEDSELSVGQEESGASACGGNGDIDVMIVAPSTADEPFLSHGRRDSDNFSNTSAEEHPTRFQNMDSAAFVMANALRIPPVPIVRPSPTRFQEEFLRKSQIYAEELMKHQMQLMAAARASAFSLRHSAGATTLPDVALGKIGFRPHNSKLLSPTDTNNTTCLPNFNGIHSHLSAITKISQLSAAAAVAASNAGCNNFGSSGVTVAGSSDTLAKLTAFGMNQNHHQPPQYQQRDLTVPHLNQLQQQMQAHLPFMNNNLHESSLKFSIDNILKADFGRRITDPLLKRGTGNQSGNSDRSANGTRSAKTSQSSWHRRNGGKNHQTGSGNSHKLTSGSAIDLTSLMAVAAVSSSTAAAITTEPPASTPSINICTNSNDSTTSSTTVLSSNYGTAIKSPASSVSPLDSVAVASNSLSASTENNASLDCNNAAGSGGLTAGSSSGSSSSSSGTITSTANGDGPIVWPAWVYCTRYSDRPSSGRSPRTRKPKKPTSEKGTSPTAIAEDKRPRTAFSGSQLARLKHEFTENRYLTEKRRQQLSSELGLNEAQIKIWFQNKRAKLKKSSGTKNPLALQLMAQGLYNHSTVPLTREEEELQEMQANAAAAAAAGAV